jgi:hypothetical protein
MMEYTILKASNLLDLEHFVNKYIQEGWRPQCGVTIQQNPQFRTVEYYLQPMIKENE